MKKNLIRGIALALVLILALGIIPLAALAKEPMYASVPEIAFNKINPPVLYYDDDIVFFGNTTQKPEGSTIKTSDYDSYTLIGGELYDFKGFSQHNEQLDTLFKELDEYLKTNPSEKDIEAYIEKMEKIPLSFSKSNIKIAAFPSRENYKSDAEFEKAAESWMLKYNWIIAGYVPHQHKLSRWYSDGTTHWRECLVCRQYNPSPETMFMYQNWCQDGDEDQVCNVCGGHVPYHDITVIESEGGKITLNRDNASHRMKITADVETNDGYQFVKLHFTKVRPDGSKQEVVRYGQGKSFWTNMPTYPMEITAEFIKK